MQNDTTGFTLWFTGLSGAGKSTIAQIIGPEIERRGILVDHLDGDVVRNRWVQAMDSQGRTLILTEGGVGRIMEGLRIRA